MIPLIARGRHANWRCFSPPVTRPRANITILAYWKIKDSVVRHLFSMRFILSAFDMSIGEHYPVCRPIMPNMNHVATVKVVIFAGPWMPAGMVDVEHLGVATCV